MLIDGRTLETGTTIEADVCIVGAGAAGLATAQGMIGGPLSVAVLERGEAQPPTPSDDGGEPWLPTGRAHSALLSRNNRYLEATRGVGLGGLGEKWRGSCRPLDPEDLAERDWVEGSGWPLTPATLAPWLERAAELLDVELAPSAPPPPPLGRGFEPAWLPFAPRRSIAELFRPAFEAASNVRVLTGVHVTRLGLDDTGGRVGTADVRCLDGPALTVRAGAFVLAAGVVENPRLLLVSSRHGLGNDNSLVGRFFMEQIALRAGHALLNGRRDVLAPYGTVGRHAGGARPLRAVLRPPRALQARHELLDSLVTVEPATTRDAGALAPSVAHLAADLEAADGAVDVVAVTVRGEQSPTRRSRVLLGDERDPFGVRLANLNWTLGWHDSWSLRTTSELFGESLGAAGDGRLRMTDSPDVTRARYRWSGHQSGTTRMSREPEDGVVDPSCRVHGVENLYVAGSSVFPTGGCSGPMLTAIALALRLGDHLRRLAARSHGG